MKSWAKLSACGRYRYTLGRRWSWRGPLACWIMLNPSVADARKDDATIRRCIGFSKLWGCGGLIVVNLFALRSTDPGELYRADDPIGVDECDRHILEAASRCQVRVAAWGAHGTFLGRDLRVKRLLESLDAQPLHHLGLTKEGQPRHPLRLAKATPLLTYEWGCK